MHIKHYIKKVSDDTYILNDVRIWYATHVRITMVHVGPLGSLIFSTEDVDVHTLAMLLHSETGQVKINRSNPEIMKFLTLTKCI